MFFPENFENKIGFSDIRTQLRGRCMSTLGTDWVDNRLRPLATAAEAREALAQAAEFQRFTNEEDEAYEENFFDVRQAILRIRPERTHMEEMELFDLKRSLRTVGDLVGSFRKKQTDGEAPTYPALFRLCQGVDTFPDVVARIESVLNKYGKVRDTASAELLQIRHQMEVTSRGISHSLRQIISEAQAEGYIDRDVAPTLRDGRLVIPVAPALKRKIRGIIHDESATGKTVFIEPSAVVDANNRIRELKAAERREVMRILQELTAEVRPHASQMLNALAFLAHIDYLRALAGFSENFDCCVPEVSDTPRIDWTGATHPILRQALRRRGLDQVPLDIALRGEARILVISGPNAGGKSVCLKTVGLLQYMMQCGMPVPMDESSKMGFFSDIFLSIGDEQSLEDSLSTYSSHLLGLKTMMKRSGPTSLLLIDEFGGGTEPQIGGALAEAILEKFVERATYGIITTHYQNLKRFAENTPSVLNGAMLYDRAQMQPLFMLRIGHPGSSFAIEIARKIGLPEDVIARAAETVGKDYVMSDKYLQDIARDKVYWENKCQRIHSQEKQLAETLANYERELEDVSRQRRTVIDQAKREAQDLLRESNARIENTIRAIKEAQAEKERTREIRSELSEYKESIEHTSEESDRITRKMEQIRRRQERRRQKRESAGTREAAQNAATEASATSSSATLHGSKNTPLGKGATNVLLHEGSFVRLHGQNTIGRIETINASGQARVLFGMIHTTVPLERLRPAEPPREDKTFRDATFVSRQTRDAISQKKIHFRPEIDLRGMRADEALQAVAHFMDDAILLGETPVRILHGTGTGALRQLTRDYLRTLGGVSNYHDEHVQAGGSGITVVELGD